MPLLDEMWIIISKKSFKSIVRGGRKDERAYFAGRVYRDCRIWILCCVEAGWLYEQC